MDSPLAAVSAGPPDLLRRFVATPYHETFLFGSVRVLAETNDSLPLNFLRELDAKSRTERSCSNDLCSFRWKLIRENDVACEPTEPMLVRSGRLTVVSMGPACLTGFDYEKNEALSFLGFAANEDGLRQALGLLTGELVRTLETAIPSPSAQSEHISSGGKNA